MTQLFKTLSDLGYIPVPIIPHDKTFTAFDGDVKPGGKTPGRYDPNTDTWHGLSGWQRFAQTPPEPHTLNKWESWTAKPGVGLLTGNLVAVDIDVTHAELSASAVKAAFDILGHTDFIRIGRAPKTLLLYRVETPLSKLRSQKFELEGVQTVEILGLGQQFVAFGIHPTTKQPYTWPNKSPLDNPISGIPSVTPEKLKEFIERFEFLAADIFGAACKSHTSETVERNSNELTDARGLIPEAAKSLPTELSDDYHQWVRVGLALKSALPNDPDLAFELFDEFSAKSDKYDAAQTQSKWDTFNPTKIGAGTLYHLAQVNGWTPSRPLPEDDFQEPYDPAKNAARVKPVTEFDDANLPKREWLLGRHLLRGYVTTLVAPGGVGKSTLTLSWAASLATGRDLAHASPQSPGKAWIINNEDDDTELMRRFAALRRHADLPWQSLSGRIHITGNATQNFVVAKKAAHGNLVATNDLQWAIDFIRQEGIDLLIVDPLVSTHRANENDNGEMEFVMNCYRRIARETNCAVCLVHHTSKPQGGSSEGFAGNQNAGRGASAVVNAARVSLTLFDMSERDAERFAVAEGERGRYVRLDDAKANLSLRSGAARWFYRESVTLGNGDEIGALKPVSLTERAIAEKDSIVEGLLEMSNLYEPGSESPGESRKVLLTEAVTFLQNIGVIERDISMLGAKKRVQKALSAPVRILQDCNIYMWYEQETGTGGKGKPSHFVHCGVK